MHSPKSGRHCKIRRRGSLAQWWVRVWGPKGIRTSGMSEARQAQGSSDSRVPIALARQSESSCPERWVR
jgi:hypothetical protein